MSAYYDNEQKLWILDEACSINAMLNILDVMSINGQYITHWCNLPLLPTRQIKSES